VGVDNQKSALKGMESQRLRIAFAMINCNRRDGSARAVNEVAERLARRHEVHLFARRAEDLDLSLVRWHRIPGLTWPEILDFGSYHLLAGLRLRPGKFDIVHSVGVNAPWANVITIQNIQPAKRVFLDSQEKLAQISVPRKLSRRAYLDTTTWVEQRMYQSSSAKRAPLFLPVSRGVEQELRKHYDIGDALVRIIPNAADTEKFKPVAERDRLAWRLANGLTTSDILLVFVGGEWSRKGLDFAIRSLPLLPDPKVKLIVLGSDPAEKSFRDLAANLRVTERVCFLGFQKDVSSALASSDIFLFPSWYEAFSLATIEAAACGLPIVATEINGTEDFITPGETGVFIEHNPQQIASVLRPLLISEAERRRMGRNARELVERSYNWDRVADLTEQAYREYLDRREIGNSLVNVG
jgi:glycosyltransferase involved in cell wall biosynthesis